MSEVPVATLLEAFGVPVTVRRPAPEDFPIETTGVWEGEPLVEERPVGNDFQRREPRRLMTLARAAVPTLPRGTTILAPAPMGSAVLTWAVDGIDKVEGDSWRVRLTRTTD